MDVMRSKKLFVAIVIAIALIVAAIYLISDRNKDKADNLDSVDDFEMMIPPDDMFINAASSQACKEFNISFSYDDSTTPIEAGGEKWQKIRWSLLVFPKEGVEAKDFYCTLILDDWVVSRSSSPTLIYMGIEKGFAGDIPSETKGVDSMMEKVVLLETTNAPEYNESMKAPVRIMLSYNGHEEYYLITPKFKDLQGVSETLQQ